MFKSERERERELGLLGIWEGVVTAIYFRKTRRVVMEPTNGHISVSHRIGEPLVDSCSEGFDSLEARTDLTLQNHFWGPLLCVCQRERSCVYNLKYLNYMPTVSLAHGYRSQRRKKNIFPLTNSSLGQTLAQQTLISYHHCQLAFLLFLIFFLFVFLLFLWTARFCFPCKVHISYNCH